jgi:nitrogen regulatory protein P-II 1
MNRSHLDDKEIVHSMHDSVATKQRWGYLLAMKLITTVVRPERLPEVKAALFQAGVTGITLSRVSGHGGEQEIVSQYRGTTVVMEFHEKVKIEMVCSEPFVEPCIKAILASARTGEVGDGKIFVQPIERVVRIRTGEMDNAALTAVNADQVQRAALESAQHSGAVAGEEDQ